jgi:c(7)-type cytochrome triheme protein
MMLQVWASLFLASTPARYDHFSEKHSKVACNDCHLRSTKKDHRPCENSGCHPGELVKFDPRKPAYCRTCHEAGPGGRGVNIRKVYYPPYRKGDDTLWGQMNAGHAVHVEGAQCETCHMENKAAPKNPDMTFTGHSGCATCHDGKAKPPMSECQGCHVKKDQALGLTSAIFTDYRIAKKFSHAEHAEKTKKNDCAGCHPNSKVQKGVRTPLPQMADCTSCHDGDQAFDVVGSECRRCHESATASPPEPVLKEKSYFSHVNHSDRKVVGEKGVYACTDCHPTTERGRLWFPGGGKNFNPKEPRRAHFPCAKCHQQQFLTKETKGICLACHEHSDPWRPNPGKPRFRDDRELVSDLPHDKHADTACDKCHFEQSGAAKPAMASGLLAPNHEVCGQCHENTTDAPMTKCDGCHRLPSEQEQQSAKWQVDQKFTHDTHQIDVRTAQVVDTATIGWARVDKSTAGKLDCTTCHLKIDSGENPKMKTCHTCHDGVLAFKDTGFGCARCHGPIQEKGS